MKDNLPPNMDALLSGWLEGDLSREEQLQFEAWLRESPEHMTRLVNASIQDQQLREVVQIQESARIIRPRAFERAPSPSRSIPWKPLLAIAATILVLLSAGLFRQPRSARVVTEVAQAEDVRLAGYSGSLAKGTKLELESISLESGRLALLLESGVHLELLAPLRARLVDSMLLHLDYGRVNADVGIHGKGFTVVTDAGDVIDLGTRFGIEADREGECRVAVFSGQVELRPRKHAKQQATITLSEGQAARFSALAGLRRWDQVALAAKAAGISSTPYAGVVSRVKDNLGDQELHPFYGVVQGGMREGALAYTDKPNPRWHAGAGGNFPDWLDGADLVRTYHQFRRKREYRLQVELRDAAMVYILQDPRDEAPEWLARDFENTGTRLRVGPWNPAVANQSGVVMEPDGPYLEAEVWRRAVPPGVLELGSPRQLQTDVPVVMYGLAVKSLAPSLN